MKRTPNDYAEALIDKYLNVKCPLKGKLMYNMSKCLAIQCAIIDVNNTLLRHWIMYLYLELKSVIEPKSLYSTTKY